MRESSGREDAPRLRQVPAVTRAVAILRLLGDAPAGMGVKAIADALRIVPSTCLHILRVLVSEGLVVQEAGTKRYSLGYGTLALSQGLLRRSGFAELVQPELDDLARRHGVMTLAVEVDGLEYMVVVAISRSPLPIRMHVDIGSRFPALISATGRCVAAFGGYPKADVDQRFRKLRWDRAPTLEAWRREVESVRRKGYSIDRGNYISGVAIVAVPVFDAELRMRRSIVAIGLAAQVDASGAAALAEEMRLAARNVSNRMAAVRGSRKDGS